MLIDWFTVGAQLLNFLVLVWLLKRFLYKPVLNAIDQREQRVAAELSDAEDKKRKATQERDEFQQKNLAFDQQRSALVSQAKQEVHVERQRMLDQARLEADTLRSARQEMIKREEKSLKAEFSRRAQAEVMAIARKTLIDLAGASLEDRIFEVFTERLRELDAGTAGAILRVGNSSDIVIIRSVFELSATRRDLIQQTLKETCHCGAPIQFELASNLVSGIELTMHGRKIAWSIGDYLSSLEKCIEAQIQSGTQAANQNVRAKENRSEVIATSQMNVGST